MKRFRFPKTMLRRLAGMFVIFFVVFALTSLLLSEEKTLPEILEDAASVAAIIAVTFSLTNRKTGAEEVLDDDSPRSFAYYAGFFVFVFLLFCALAYPVLLVIFLVGLFTDTPMDIARLLLVPMLLFLLFALIGTVLYYFTRRLPK
ncbi:MAG TPA: hypothetical protein VFZ78_11225 [Flavisolibacter sp.]